ncbi:MAG: hypothetical protein GF409_03860 [Candidatus Omnitrophica bacterium]|nr:hypothetical protein [Candidatus Omnitrophota bacterium]
MGFVIALFWMAVSGVFLAAVFLGGLRRRKAQEILPLSFFLGAGFVSFQFLTLYLFDRGFSMLNIIALPGFMLLTIAAIWLRGDQVRPAAVRIKPAQKVAVVEKMLAAGILIQLVWVLLQVFPMPVHSHDAVANYAFKAKIISLSGAIPDGFFTWGEATMSHPDYPLLLPLVASWIYAFTGFSYFGVNLLMPVVYISFLVLFYAILRKSFPRKYSLLAVFVLATIPQITNYATIMYADLLLGAFVSCGFLYLVQYIRGAERADLLLAAALFAISIWVKNEGMVFAGCFWAALIFFYANSDMIARKRMRKEFVTAFLLMCVITAPWLTVRMQAAANSDLDISALTFSRFIQNLKDIPLFLNFLQQEVFGPKKWNIFWVVFIAVLIWKRKLLCRGDRLYMTLFFALAFAGYFSAYMLTTGENLYFYVNTTISRFMIHFSGIGLFIMADLAYKDIKEVGFTGGLDDG